mgnify:CR=1 FL=1
MKLLTNIFIDTSDFGSEEPTYEQLELFDFETIELTSSIQNVRDIASIFTDYSQQFTIPASKINNRILKHFYSLYLTNGYDARIKRDAYININGITFRDGYIRLSKAELRNGKPFSYSITFFGKIVNLKDILGDDELKDLDSLTIYNHEYSLSNVYSGFNIGLAFDPVTESMVESADRDLVYPSISAQNKWFYDSDGTPSSDFLQGRSVNLYRPTDGIDYRQLKPAIKAKRILEAIEEKYASITFSDDFFSDTDFNELYMLLHAKKGVLSSGSSGLSQERTFSLSEGLQGDFDKISGDSGIIPIETWTRVEQQKTITKICNLVVSIEALTITGNGNYNLQVLDNDGNVLASGSYSGVGTPNVLPFTLSSNNDRFWDVRFVISSEGELNDYELKANLTSIEEYVDEDPFGFPVVLDITKTALYEAKSQNSSMFTEVVVREQFPKITVLDFLRGLFKTFNLTAYVEDGVIIVKTLNEFYSEGVDRDLSSELDLRSVSVKRSKLFSNIKFEFQEPKTFGVTNQNEVFQDNFGDLEFQATEDGKSGNLVFDGSNYEVKLPFEKLFFERLSDEKDLSLPKTPLTNGWLVDKDQEPILTKPVLFFNINTVVDSSEFQIGFTGIQTALTNYNRPSNSSRTESVSIHFGEEVDEFSGNQLVNSLFNNYYDDYILNLYSNTTRIVDFNMVLKLNTLIKYKMNDRIIIDGNYYRINQIKTNLTTGKSDLELITDFKEIDTQAPTVPTGLTAVGTSSTELLVSWVASTDNVEVTGYEVYVDGDLDVVVGKVESVVLNNLDEDTSYSIEVLAFDAAGNKSAKTSPVFGDTLVFDNTPPSQVTDLATEDVRDDAIEFKFTPSTPSSNAILRYNIWLDQTLLQETIDDLTVDPVDGKIYYALFGLQSQTTYDIQVQAVDLIGNESLLSNTITNTTTA